MSRINRYALERLVQLAGVIRDLHQAERAALLQERERLINRLAALETPVPDVPDMSPQALQEVAIRHQLWAEPRRIALNEALARQTAALMASEAGQRRATGRALVLEQLALRATRRPRDQLS